MASLTKAHVLKMQRILEKDRREILLRLDAYNKGVQDDPWLPDNADSEYRLLAERSKTNIVPFLISTPAQALYVDQFRRGEVETTLSEDAVASLAAKQPEWDHWERSNLQSRQAAIYRGALNFGHAFTVTTFDKKGKKELKTRGLSPLRTTALFEDPANDIVPVHSFTVVSWPSENIKGKGLAWDETHEYEVQFRALGDAEGMTVKKLKPHGASENPVTRFAAFVDLEGRTSGVVEPLLELQNRLNQTVFDMMVVQSYAAFKVRTVTGMAPPVIMDPVYEDGEIVSWEPRIDEETGKMIPDQQNINARRWMWAEDPDVKFGTLDETPLDGFIAAIDLAFRHIAALGQVPPHHLLGQIANLSAEALVAAETALQRKVEEFKSSFGVAWERVFRLAMEMLGEDGADDFHGEVIWRDMEQRSLAQAGDALGKLREQLGIPARGLWSRVPGATASEIRKWEQLAEQEEPSIRLANALGNADAQGTVPQFREPTAPVDPEAAA